jgi:glutamate-1-semialdehyde 2,1-aminomutase
VTESFEIEEDPMIYNRSGEILERSIQVVGGATMSDLRANWGRFQLVYERGEGSRIWDVDGNEYIDYCLGGGPLILGHCFPGLVEAIGDQLGKGISFGAQTELDVRLAEKFCDLVPCADLVRFGCSGSEVNHAAMRLARACTGRPKILKFEGHYHGWFDTMAWDSDFVSGNPGPREKPVLTPLSPAQLPESSANLLLLPWNDLDLLERTFRNRGKEIAAVITEPVMSQCGIAPLPGYLEGLRNVCDRWGSLLIFDEVVTGFRWSLGGAQEYFGVTPDLATFAKGMGGGVVVSALAGKKEYMNRWGEFMPILAGTFNCNPLSMAGALATLEAISADGGRLLKHTFDMTARLTEGLSRLAEKTSLPLLVQGHPSCVLSAFVPQPCEPLVDARSAMQINFALTREFCFELQERGIRMAPTGGWGLGAAHTERDVQEALDAAEDALAALEKSALASDSQRPLPVSETERARTIAGMIGRLFKRRV